MRELTLAELDFISGSGYYDNEDVVVTGTRYPPPYSFPPSYPPGVGYTGNPPSYPPGGGYTPAYGAPHMDLEGRDCPEEKAEADKSLDSLYANSATAKALIDTAARNGVDINIVKASTSGFGAQARYDSGVITWDPYLSVQGTNTNGSTYTMSPIMILAHELVHAGHANDPAYQGASSETLVMSISNQIAREMNASTSSNFDTSRDVHENTGSYNVSSATSTTYSISRPGCS